MSNSNLFPILIRWAILMVLVAAGLLLAAGTAHLPMLNAYNLVTIFMAALDVGRLHLSNRVPLALGVIALVMYIAGSGFQAWAMSVNSLYSPVIHVQTELGHSVVTRGPYRILRHPAYFANIVAIPASALAIGSWIALIPATLFCAITVWRARREDAFLKQNLPGYKDYMESVPGGVFPRLSFKL